VGELHMRGKKDWFWQLELMGYMEGGFKWGVLLRNLWAGMNHLVPISDGKGVVGAMGRNEKGDSVQVTYRRAGGLGVCGESEQMPKTAKKIWGSGLLRWAVSREKLGGIRGWVEVGGK